MPTQVTATQSDSADPANKEEWRPTSSASRDAQERSKFLADWTDKPAVDAKPAREAATDDDLDEDPEDEEDDSDDDGIEAEAAPVEKPVKKAVAKPVADEDPDDEEDEDPDDDSDLDDEGDPAKAVTDPAVAKGFAKLQKQEQRMRQQLDQERSQWQATVARERDSHQAELARHKVEYQTQFHARLKRDPMAVLEEVGLEDFESLGKQAYFRAKGATDPAYREAATKMSREREMALKLSDVEKKFAALEQSDAEQKQQTALQRQLDTYLGSVTKEAPRVAKATLTQKMLAADPDYAKAQFARAAHDLWQSTGREPTARAVVIAVEKSERSILRRYGIDPRTMAAQPAAAGVAAGKRKPAKGGKKSARGADDDLALPTRDQLLEEDWSR